ncbi:MAG: transposase domain-containing protein [Nevskia sp.]|nr:transposase domain-containing protein [Nevskia sp.]
MLASALERKNCLFCGSGDGSDRAAAIYNPIGTATLNGLDPAAYLRHVIGRITEHSANQLEALPPWNVALHPG